MTVNTHDDVLVRCPRCGEKMNAANTNTGSGRLLTIYVCPKAIGEEAFDPFFKTRFFPAGSVHDRVVYYHELKAREMAAQEGQGYGDFS